VSANLSRCSLRDARAASRLRGGTIRARETGRVEYIPAAAGRTEDTLSLLVPDDPGGSSFLPASRKGDSYFKRSVTVPVLPLSSLDIPSGPTVLTLDVQGFELEAIAGADPILDQVEVIIAECSLYPFQQGSTNS
jgi:FkbM family methyltransferase